MHHRMTIPMPGGGDDQHNYASDPPGMASPMNIREFRILLQQELDSSEPISMLLHESTQSAIPDQEFDSIEAYREYLLRKPVKVDDLYHNREHLDQLLWLGGNTIVAALQSFKISLGPAMSKALASLMPINTRGALCDGLGRLMSGYWILLIASSGSFAMGVVDGDTLCFVDSVVTKRYTSRRKAGFSQHKLDNMKKVTSMGSIIRREQENKLIEDLHTALFTFRQKYHPAFMFWNDNYIFRGLVKECLPTTPCIEFGFECTVISREELDSCLNKLVQTPCKSNL